MTASAIRVTIGAGPDLGTVTLEDKSAAGDGSTDDHAAYTSAMATGKTIVLGGKTYLVPGYTGNFAAAGQSLIGRGGTSQLKNLSNQAIVQAGADEQQFAHFYTFGTFGAGSSNHGVDLQSFCKTIVSSVYAYAPGGSGFHSAAGGTANMGPLFVGVRCFDPVNGAGLHCDLAEYVTAIGASFYGGTYGVWNNGGNNFFIGIRAELNTTGLLVDNGDSNDGHGMFIAGSLNHNTTYAADVKPLTNGFAIYASHMYYAAIRVVGTDGSHATPTLIDFAKNWIDVTGFTLTNALVQFDGNVMPSSNANTVTNSGSTIIARPNNMKLDGTPFDFGVNTRWDTPSTRAHEHRFGGVVKHSIDGAHGLGMFGGAGSDLVVYLGPMPSFSTADAGFWALANGVAASSVNPCTYSNGSDTFVNTPHSLGFGKIFHYAGASTLMGTKDPVALKYTLPLQFVTSKFSATTPQAMTLSNGANNNLAVTSSKVRITGPSGAFSVSGFAQPVDGSSNVLDGAELLIYNMTAQAMTITNLATSSANNQIDTLTGADVVLPTRKSFARFTYDGTSSKWILTDHS